MPTKSGKFWVTWADTNAPNSHRLEDLAEPFRTQAQTFIAALKAAGASVTVSATLRSEKRAHLFHWSWKVALGVVPASQVPTRPDIDIQWDHGNDAASRAGAREMVDGFGLAVPPKSTKAPALSSNHIRGTAVDMQIAWTDTITVKNALGQGVPVTFMSNVDSNKPLHHVGASYGVLKLVGDAPHW